MKAVPGLSQVSAWESDDACATYIVPADEETVRLAIARACAQCGLDPDWDRLGPESADWGAADGPARILLYSLKALAFIRLRREDPAGAGAILDALARIDPQDRIGAGVVRALADGSAPTQAPGA